MKLLSGPRTAAAIALAALAACPLPQEAGYEGPLPSVEARTTCLTPLMGRTFTPPPGVLGGAELRVTGFAVGADPIVRLTPAAETWDTAENRFVPVYTDGDCAAFYELVTAERIERFAGATSEGYRAAVAPRGADEPR